MKKDSKGKVVGYCIFAHDNNTFMFEEDDPVLKRCSRCNFKLDFRTTNPEYALRKSFRSIASGIPVSKSQAISYTYDGQIIASLAFRDFCVEREYKGADFIPFPKDPLHFHLLSNRQLAVDTTRGNVRFVDFCPTCGNFAGTHRSDLFFKVRDPLPTGFFGTNLIFGHGDRKGENVILSIDVVAEIKAHKFKGIIFAPVYGQDE